MSCRARPQLAIEAGLAFCGGDCIEMRTVHTVCGMCVVHCDCDIFGRPSRTYHLRANQELVEKALHLTRCGRLVNYQQTMGSPDDVDCAACLEAASLVS